MYNLFNTTHEILVLLVLIACTQKPHFNAKTDFSIGSLHLQPNIRATKAPAHLRRNRMLDKRQEPYSHVCSDSPFLPFNRTRGYKTFFTLNSTEHVISNVHKKIKYRQIKKFLALSLSDVVFILPINVKMPTIVGILTFMSRINSVFSSVEHGKSFIISGPGLFNLADYFLSFYAVAFQLIIGI